MLKSSAFIILLAVSAARCQFFYNYEEDRASEPQGTQEYDPSAYQYSPPSQVNQQFVQPRSDPETSDQNGYTRTRVRVRSRNYPPEQYYNEPQSANIPEAQPEIDRSALRQERRQARRRQREQYYVQPPQSARVYSPSIFENIELGQAPTGVYIPHDSFLNVLQSSSQRPTSSAPSVAPQTNYVSNDRQPTFFVQPPSNEDNFSQRNVILPISRPQNVAPPPPPPPQQTVQARAVGTNRRPRQRTRVQAQPAPPTVDIDSYREFTDDVAREDIQIMPQVEYVNTRQRTRPQNRRRKITSYQETTPAPRVYSPSVFQNIGLGEAPSGIYVPDDSPLNILRNPSAERHSGNRISRRASEHVALQQPTHYEADIQDDYSSEIIEPQYIPPPPPPPPQPRRRSSQRSRQESLPNRSANRRYQDEYDTQIAVQPVQPSSQRRTQRRDEDFDDFQRQQPPVRPQARPQRRQQETAPQRRQAAAAVPRQQLQESSPDREQSTFKKAKLAIAALPIDTDDDGIPGEAGVNYPTLHVIPKTAFSCREQPHNGYYADLETSCQVVHLCQSGGVQSSFLCPNGTIFSQEKFSCQWWYKVNCSESPRFYIKNDDLYKVPEKKERKRN